MSKLVTVSDFTKYHNFVLPDYLKDDESVIRWLCDIKATVDEGVASTFEALVAQQEPTWAALWNMIDRVYEHEAAAVVGFFTGGWASMEVVVRAVIEASVTVIFVASGNRNQRLGQYLAHYFLATNRAIEKLGAGVDSDHRREHLKFRETFIRKVAALEGIPFDAAGWPPAVFDRFKAVGMEVEYRRIYNVLSSQAHNDADALIDYILVKSLSHSDEDSQRLAAAEMLFWMRFYLYSGLRYYALAAKTLASVFVWKDGPTIRIGQLEGEILEHLDLLTQGFEALRDTA